MRQNGLEARATWRRRGWLLGTALGALLLAGCGTEVYEQRLGNTRLLFAHMDQLNQNLQGAWSDPETGVSLRVPTQFVMLPPPVKTPADPVADKNKRPQGRPAKEADGPYPAKGEEVQEEDPDEVPDDRQPKYINIELPGLRGAFRASVKMIAANNASSQGDAFLYVMTNHDLAEKPDEARDFEQEFIKTLTEALHVSVDADKDWIEDKFPSGDPSKNGFVRPVKYKNVTVTSAEDIAGYTRQFSAYMFEQGDIQVIVLFVLPADTDTTENFTKRIPLCLETLSVFGDELAPSRQRRRAARAGTPTNAF